MTWKNSSSPIASMSMNPYPESQALALSAVAEMSPFRNFAEFPSHRVSRDRGITHVEWLCNLEELVGAGVFQFQAIPLKFKRGSGSPVRALAILD
jgi:kynurenine formamidase